MAESENEQYGHEVIPAFEKWKNQVLDALFQLTEIYGEATEDGEMTEYENSTFRFKSAVIKLWLLMGEQKVNLPKNSVPFQRLRELNRFVRRPADMSVDEALGYFVLLRAWIEVLGYTRIESKKLDPTDFPGQKVGQ